MKKVLVKMVCLVMVVVMVTNVNSFAVGAVGLGDVNLDGNISPLDALMLLQGAAALIVLSEEQLAVADANFDGSINPIDALVVLQRASHLVNYVEYGFSADLSKWTVSSGNWVIQDEMLMQDAVSDSVLLLNDVQAGNQTVQFRFKMNTGGYFGAVIWYKDSSNYSLIRAYPSTDKVYFGEVVNGVYSGISQRFETNFNTWYQMKIVADVDGNISVYIDTIFVKSRQSVNTFGSTGLFSSNVSYFDDFKLLYS